MLYYRSKRVNTKNSNILAYYYAPGLWPLQMPFATAFMAWIWQKQRHIEPA